jgi:hypothetical protein
MSNLLSNPWIIGIGGGILSGLVVTFISRSIFSRRDNKEYLQKVSQANKEVLYAIRPGISEGIIPSNNVVRRLIEATARRYGIEVSSMYSLDKVSGDLIKEVMDSSFISAASKQQYCEQLAQINDATPDDLSVPDHIRSIDASTYRRTAVMMMGLMTGLITALAGFSLTIEKDVINDTKKLVILLVPALVAVLVSIISVFFKEVQSMRLRRMEINFSGIRAELGRRDDIDQEDA